MFMAIIRRSEGESGLAQGRGWDPLEVVRDMMGWDPFRELARTGLGSREGGQAFIPTFEVKETKDAYVFKADLPGVKEENLDISLTWNRLTLSGHREEDKKDEGETYFTYERSYGSFSRSFTLPEGVDPDHVQAELKEGVLSVILPKKPEVQPKRIQLKAGGKAEKDRAKA